MMFRRARLDMPGAPHDMLVRGIKRPPIFLGVTISAIIRAVGDRISKGKNESCNVCNKVLKSHPLSC